jgi:hypothetical protein
VRKNITETQAGVPMHLEIQFINVKNCKPVENLLVDVWHVSVFHFYLIWMNTSNLILRPMEPELILELQERED